MIKVVYKKVDEIIPYAGNPRDNEKAVKLVADSILEFGFKVPIVLDATNTIVCGHTRWKAAKKLKLERVPCVIADDLSEEQVKAFRLADNKTAEFSGWDMELLQKELEGINSINMELFGFDLSEFDVDINEIIEDEIPYMSEGKEAFTKKGDIWILGSHRLMCGDSTKKEDVAHLLDGQTAQLAVTDPPYNVDYEGKAGKIKNDNMSGNEFYDFLVQAFHNMFENIEPGAAVYIFHADTEGINFRTAFQKSGFELKQCLVWVKNHFVLGRQDYQWQHEPILYGWKKGAGHYFTADRTQTTAIFEDKPLASEMHPTMKPVGLVARLIKNSSKKGWSVLDLFGGSGTTLIACEQLNRRCFTMELEPKFCDVIVKRYMKLTGNTAILKRGEQEKEIEEI